MLAAEEAYCAKEDELREYLDTYEATHDYDEYHFDLDEIEHDPYVLISILSALHEGVFTIDQVQGDLQTLFDKQYILTETVTTETRYRTETRTDSEGNTYTVRVPYTWTICTVTLENFDLSHVPVYMMGEEQLSLYATYMSTLGNRPDLFPSSGYVNKYIENPPTAWEIPAEYLTDERFNTLITEAEKYLGYPYVWGGSSPSTSFDCSGFVSYVLTNSGLCNTGRLGAQGLYNISTPVSDPPARRSGVLRGHLRYQRRIPCGHLCRRRDDAALRRPYPVFQPEYELLAVPFLRIRQAALQLMEVMKHQYGFLWGWCQQHRPS